MVTDKIVEGIKPANMKSLKNESIVFLMLVALLLCVCSCSHEEDMVIPVEPSYTDPQKDLEAFEQQLQSSENGWEAILSPQPGKMYRLFFELEPTGEASLYADADTVAAKTPTLTSYSIQLTQRVNPTLIFGTGSNLERIPGGGKNPGVDRAYSFKYTKEDTVYLLGNEYGDELKLIKATKSAHDRYVSSGLKNSVKEISAYLSTVRYLYIQPEDDKVIQFITNPVSKGIYVTYLNNGAKFFGSDYAYSLNGIELKSSLHALGYKAGEIFWDSSIKRLYTYYNDLRIDLKPSPIPVIPLHYLLGDEYPAGAAFPSLYLGWLPGWSAKFQNLWLADDDALENMNISLYYVVTDLHVENNTMDLFVYYVNPDDVYVRGKFPYTFSKTADGIYSFTPLPIDDTPEGDNARVLEGRLPNIFGVINGNRFRIEFFDAFEALGGVIPQYISEDDSDLYFTGFFY
jgi:hypothetical protein